MAEIDQLLTQILNSKFGKDMRQAIHDGIAQCYDDVTNPDLNVDAFETAVQNKIDSGELANMTIPDGSITKEKLDPNLELGVEDGSVTTLKLSNGSVTPIKTSFLDENTEKYIFDDIYAKGYLVRGINEVLYNSAYDQKTTILVELNGGDCHISADYANTFTYVWIDNFTDGENVIVAESGEKILDSEQSDYSATIINSNKHKYLLGSFGIDQSKPPQGVEVEVYTGTYETSDLITGLKSPDIIDTKNVKEKAITAEKIADSSVVEDKIADKSVTADKTSFWSYDKINIIANSKPLKKIVIPYTVTKEAIFEASYNIFEFSKPGYVAKLVPGVEYLPVLDANEGENVSFYTTDEIARIEECNVFDEDQYDDLEDAGYDTSEIRYTTGDKFNKTALKSWVHSQRFTVELECYIYLSDNTDVYVWNDIAWLNQYTSYTDVIKLFSSTKQYFDLPLNFTKTYHRIGNPIFFEDFAPSDRLQRLIRRTNFIDALKYSTFNVAFLGDSITAAASNAGLERAFRKQVRYKLHLNYQNDLAVNGTCVTNGCGVSWDDQNRTGINGIFANAAYFVNILDDPKKIPHIFVVALGTNDFGNDAPLGDVESEDRETTFAGCYLKLIETIRENYPESHIICMCPLDRQNAKTENTVGCTLLDYVRVIYEIVSITEHTWILDLSNNSIINYENYPKAYIDTIHVNKYAHAVITDHLCDLILRIISVAGFDYIN